jgi:hypothetical protein
MKHSFDTYNRLTFIISESALRILLFTLFPLLLIIIIVVFGRTRRRTDVILSSDQRLIVIVIIILVMIIINRTDWLKRAK